MVDILNISCRYLPAEYFLRVSLKSIQSGNENRTMKINKCWRNALKKCHKDEQEIFEILSLKLLTKTNIYPKEYCAATCVYTYLWRTKDLVSITRLTEQDRVVAQR